MFTSHVYHPIFLAGDEGVGTFQHLLSVTQQDILTGQFVAMFMIARRRNISGYVCYDQTRKHDLFLILK